MPPKETATESRRSLPLYRVLEDEYICLHGPLPSGYPWLFLQSHIKRTKCLLEKLRACADGDLVSTYLWGKLSEDDRKSVNAYCDSPSGGVTKLKVQKILIDLLNKEVENDELRDQEIPASPSNKETENGQPNRQKIFANLQRNLETSSLLKQTRLRHSEAVRLNRLLLEQVYPEELESIYENALKNIPPNMRESILPEDGDPNLRNEELNKLGAIHLSAIYSLTHNLKEKRTALCLSGGGVRSATFNLGILQGLARQRLLEKFHYLSTVSGGGYIGSWLSAWSYRHPGGLKGVMDELRDKPHSTFDPEPKPVEYLRDYSNPQTPQAGVLSADFWTLVAVYIRNLLLNWMTFVPLLLAVLVIPRIFIAMVRIHPPNWDHWLLLTGLCAATVSVIFTGLNLPSSGRSNQTQGSFLVSCLLPLIISAMAFAAFWACQKRREVTLKETAIAAIVVSLCGLAAYTGARFKRRYNPKFYGRRKIAYLIAGSVALTLLAATITGLLGAQLVKSDQMWHLKRSLSGFDPRLFVCFGVPILLSLYTLGGTLVAGFTSRWTGEDDQEWWARSFAWVIIVIIGWSAINALVLYGPSLFLSDWLSSGRWTRIGKFLTVVIGMTSGIFTLIGGLSDKTLARKQHETYAMRLPMLQKLSKLAAPFFFAFLIIIFSLATNWLLVSFSRLAVWLMLKVYGAYDVLLINLQGIEVEIFKSSIAPLAKLSELGISAVQHLGILKESPLRLVVTFFFVLAVLGWVMGLIIDSNKFSLHSYYGNRLKRTYLGASREKRGGNLFTGFDTCDNIQMHELRSAWLRKKNFKDIGRFIDRIKNYNQQHDPLSAYIYERLSPSTKTLLEAPSSSSFPSGELKRELIHDLNKLLDGNSLYIAGLDLGRWREEIEQLLKHSSQGETRIIINRRILAAVYSDEIDEYECPKMLHVVCMALNLAKSGKLSWQERKAETFTVSPLHSGNLWLGYRRSRYYGGNNGISLGTAFTISGAAASPNMGYMLSSPLASFLMSMFNVRLGWWLGNPGEAGDKTFERDVPGFVLGPLVQEALSQADDNKRYVYLSDGGHFENLGLYEMVLRRCHIIVVSDASTDARYTYDSLGMAIRKIRIDLGIPIEFEEFRFGCGARDRNNAENKHCAIARIHYSCVDDEGTDGVLIYIKPDISGDEPRDVLNYKNDSPKFPQESIADQFFDEPQFESYRMLGSHIMGELCGYNKERLDATDVVERAYNHWKIVAEELPWMEEWLRNQKGETTSPAPEPDEPQPKVPAGEAAAAPAPLDNGQLTRVMPQGSPVISTVAPRGAKASRKNNGSNRGQPGNHSGSTG
jgi:hypothetical protein